MNTQSLKPAAGAVIRPILFLLAILLLVVPTLAWAQEVEPAGNPAFIDYFQSFLATLTYWLDLVLFYDIFGFPLLLIWLVGAGIYFTLRLGFVNVRMFGHGFNVARGKYSEKSDTGMFLPSQHSPLRWQAQSGWVTSPVWPWLSAWAAPARLSG